MMTTIKKKIICAGIAVGISFLITGGVVREQKLEEKIEKTQEGLAEEVFRFHVLANSNSEADQSLKLEVRDAVLSYMKESLPAHTTKQETKAWAAENLDTLELVAEAEMRNHGYGYQANARIGVVDFPEKSYGDITFPEGEYEALQIELGEGKGNNWWCVLYPNLCFIDCVYAVVPEEGKEEMEEVLTEDEYEMVTMGTRFKIKWFFFDCN